MYITCTNPQVAELTQSRNTISEERDALSQQLTEQVTLTESLQKTIVELNAQISDQDQRLAEELSNVETLKSSAEALNAEIVTLQSRIAEEASHNEELKIQIEGFKRKVSEQQDLLEDAMLAQRRWADEKDALEKCVLCRVFVCVAACVCVCVCVCMHALS